MHTVGLRRHGESPGLLNGAVLGDQPSLPGCAGGGHCAARLVTAAGAMSMVRAQTVDRPASSLSSGSSDTSLGGLCFLNEEPPVPLRPPHPSPGPWSRPVGRDPSPRAPLPSQLPARVCPPPQARKLRPRERARSGGKSSSTLAMGGAPRPPGEGGEAVHCDPGFSFVHPFSALAHWGCGGGRGQLS